jgi:hypothetical protein
MKTEDFIPLKDLCLLYQVEMSFFDSLKDIGIIEITTFEQVHYIREDTVTLIEKVIRMHHELDVNIEGVAVAFHLLEKINELQSEVVTLKNRLRIFEN